MEQTLHKLTRTGIEYKAADFKPEIHFMGTIIGLSNVFEDEGVFCELFFEAGKDWEMLSPNLTIQTQTGYKNENNFLTFAHPFELFYTTNNIYGWPKLVARLWKLDETNKVDLCK
jgi:hypothetical protein